MIRPTISMLSAIALLLVLGHSASAAQRCFPEVDDEVFVFFEKGDLSEPIVIGALWNGRDVVPEASEEVSVLGPRHVATALLRAIGRQSATGSRDTDVGSVVRMLAETTAQETEKAYRALQEVYESAFVDTAEGRSKEFPDFVAELIEGTFDANVDQSIEQMEAYGELVDDVGKTYDAFAKGKLSERERDDSFLALAADLIDLDREIRDDDCD